MKSVSWYAVGFVVKACCRSWCWPVLVWMMASLLSLSSCCSVLSADPSPRIKRNPEMPVLQLVLQQQADQQLRHPSQLQSQRRMTNRNPNQMPMSKRRKVINYETEVKKSPIICNQRWTRSWSQFLGSQPTGDLVINPVVGCLYLLVCYLKLVVDTRWPNCWAWAVSSPSVYFNQPAMVSWTCAANSPRTTF